MWPGPYGDWGSKKYLVASLDQSLQRLGLEYVDIFYHHRPDPDTPLEETIGALDLIVRQGKALYAGVSNYSGGAVRRGRARSCRDTTGTPIMIHQPKINMLDRRPIDDLLPADRAGGHGRDRLLPAGPGPADRPLPRRPARRQPPGPPRQGRPGLVRPASGRRHLGQGRASSARWPAPAARALAQLALTWLLSDQRITSVLIGASKVEQIEENIAAATAPLLSEEEKKQVAGILG